MKTIILFLSAFTLTTVISFSAMTFISSLEPCEFEDGINCYWDASKQGNGYGSNFVSLGIEAINVTIYYNPSEF